MIDLLRDIFASWSERIRSPILGSILVAFLLLNWKATLFLLFADAAIVEKIRFIEENTSAVGLYILPVLIGVTFALGSPWIKYWGGWWAVKPQVKQERLLMEKDRGIRIFQMQQDVEEIRAKADIEDAEETRKIAARERLNQAIEVGAENELETYRLAATLPEEARSILKPVSVIVNGSFELNTDGNEVTLKSGGLALRTASGDGVPERYSLAIDLLLENELIKNITNDKYELSEKGKELGKLMSESILLSI
jgi:hypothetical protein